MGLEKGNFGGRVKGIRRQTSKVKINLKGIRCFVLKLLSARVQNLWYCWV